MTIEKNVALIINNNWEEVKSQMRHTWRKLSEEQVEAMNNYDDLVDRLCDVYELSKDDISEKVNTFIEKLGLEPNLTYVQGIKESIYENASVIKDKVMDNLQYDSLKKNAVEVQSEVTNYVKKNPLKSIGFGVLAALIVKKLFTSNSR